MIRFQLALAGMLIVPALAPAQDPKPPEPPAPVSRPISGLSHDQEQRATYHATIPSHETPLQANFGLQLAPADDALRAQLEIPPGRGVVVVGVQPGSLAEQAGLKPNDILVRLGDREVNGVEMATKALLGLGKEAMEVKLIRRGKPSRMSLVGPEHGFPAEAAVFWIGVPVSRVNPTLRSHLPALESDVGLIVNDVVKGSPAEAAGLQKNDVLTSMGGKPLRTADTLIEQVQASRGQPVPLDVLRNGKPVTLSVTPAKRAHPTTIDLPGDRTRRRAYRVLEPQVAVEVNPNGPRNAPARSLFAQPGQSHWEFGLPYLVNPSVAPVGPQADTRLDAIVVNPFRVNGADLGKASDPPLDIRFRMMPRPEVRDVEATARIEARLNEISARLEEIRKALDGIKKAEAR